MSNPSEAEEVHKQEQSRPDSCCRLDRVPVVIGVDSVPTPHFIAMVRMRLGVASSTAAANAACSFCGVARESLGLHALSCTLGGDTHNTVRDAILNFARRARLEPVLERVGLLPEPGRFLDLRRPALQLTPYSLPWKSMS